MKQTIDLAHSSVRELNSALHALDPGDDGQAGGQVSEWTVCNPRGAHAIAVGINAPARVHIDGHVGYYCAGMNKYADITINGNAGVGVAENMMSGVVHVKGDASQSAAATAQGGMLIVEGNASARCAISLKGADVVVKGNIGHMSAFMAQAGNLVVLGDAGEALGDSLYEARLFVRGKVASLGADCEEKKMKAKHHVLLAGLLTRAGLGEDPDTSAFRRYGSARKLYNFNTDNVDAY
ncbi:MAG: glutamate synthase domain-containing protein 3 [Gammaproteobacteria bacterium]|jgi:glutamate synthase domain-containing protein 3